MSQKFKRFITRDNKRDVMRLAYEMAGALLQVHDKAVVEVREKTRTDEQNAKLHAMLGDIAKQKTFNGQKLSIEQWKMIFVSGHRIATGGTAEMAIGLEGEVIVARREAQRQRKAKIRASRWYRVMKRRRIKKLLSKQMNRK